MITFRNPIDPGDNVKPSKRANKGAPDLSKNEVHWQQTSAADNLSKLLRQTTCDQAKPRRTTRESTPGLVRPMVSSRNAPSTANSGQTEPCDVPISICPPSPAPCPRGRRWTLPQGEGELETEIAPQLMGNFDETPRGMPWVVHEQMFCV